MAGGLFPLQSRVTKGSEKGPRRRLLKGTTVRACDPLSLPTLVCTTPWHTHGVRGLVTDPQRRCLDTKEWLWGSGRHMRHPCQ